MQKLFWRWLVLLTTIATITVNSLANIIPFNGQTTGDISDSFSIYFVPAGYVFSIWGVIYLGIAAYSVYQVLPKTMSQKLLTHIAPWVILSNVANAAWIVFWHYNYPRFTVCIMAVLLLTLIKICDAIWKTVRASKKQSVAFNWCVRIPFEIYLGWISVATIANVSVALTVQEWSGFDIDPSWWAVIMLIVATILGLLLLWRERAYPSVLVFIWAFIGIGVKFSDVAHEYVTAMACVFVLIIAMIVRFTLKKK